MRKEILRRNFLEKIAMGTGSLLLIPFSSKLYLDLKAQEKSAKKTFIEKKLREAAESRADYDKLKVHQACWHYMKEGCNQIFLGTFKDENIVKVLERTHGDGHETWRQGIMFNFKNDATYLKDDGVFPQGRSRTSAEKEFIRVFSKYLRPQHYPDAQRGNLSNDLIIGGDAHWEGDKFILKDWYLKSAPNFTPENQVVIFAKETKVEGRKMNEYLYRTHLTIDWARKCFERFINDYAEGAAKNFK